MDKVDYTDEPSTSGCSPNSGGKSTVKFSTLKRTAAAADDDTEQIVAPDKIPRIQDSPRYNNQDNISIYNRFQCLTQDQPIKSEESMREHGAISDVEESDPSGASGERTRGMENAAAHRERKPPIYLAIKIVNYAQFSKNLVNSIGANFNLKYLGSQVKIQFHKLQDFIDFKNFAITKNFAFHTYSLPEEKTLTK